MAMELLAVIVILIGIALSFTLKGEAARRARKWYVISLALALGGCLGSLSWLDAETSGQQNFASGFNPFIFAGMFVIGMLVMFFNSLQVFKARADQKSAGPNAKPQTDSGSDSETDPESDADFDKREF